MVIGKLKGDDSVNDVAVITTMSSTNDAKMLHERFDSLSAE